MTHPLRTLALLAPLLTLTYQTLEAATEPAVPAEAPAAKSAEAPKSPLHEAYALCSQYGDVAAAAPLAYQLAIAEPAETAKWKEELAKIHFATQRYASCLKILADLTENHDCAEKLPVLEMKGLCHEALEQKDEATATWQAVWEKGGSAASAVRYAGLLFEQGKLEDAGNVISLGLAAKDAETAMISLPKTREQMQQIPAAATLHNLKALLLMKQDPAAKDAVRTELHKALALAPDYEIAKRNLANLTEETAAAQETAKPDPSSTKN